MPSRRDPAPDRTVASAERTVTILNAFLAKDGPLSLTELESITGLFKSVILRYMITLIKERFVSRLDDGNYQLGTKVFVLASHHEKSIDHAEILNKSLQNLGSKTGETASFYIREGETRICLFRQNSYHSLRVSLRQGDTLPLDETSTGLVLRHADGTPTVEGRYIRQTAGLNDPLTTSISAPVFDARERVAGALTLSGPIGRFRPSDPATQALLHAEAAKLSGIFGSAVHYRTPFDGASPAVEGGDSGRRGGAAHRRARSARVG